MSPTALPTLAPLVPTASPTHHPSRNPTKDPSDFPYALDINFEGDYDTIVTDKHAFLQDCTLHVVPLVCSNVREGMIVTLQGTEDHVRAAELDINNNGLNIQGYSTLRVDDTPSSGSSDTFKSDDDSNDSTWIIVIVVVLILICIIIVVFLLQEYICGSDSKSLKRSASKGSDPFQEMEVQDVPQPKRTHTTIMTTHSTSTTKTVTAVDEAGGGVYSTPAQTATPGNMGTATMGGDYDYEIEGPTLTRAEILDDGFPIE